MMRRDNIEPEVLKSWLESGSGRAHGRTWADVLGSITEPASLQFEALEKKGKLRTFEGL
jgi:hypothetical protein